MLGWFFFVEPRNSFAVDDLAGLFRILNYAFFCAITILLFYRTHRTAVALAETADRFQRVSRATSDAIYDWNIRKNHLWWSEGINRLFNYPVAKVPDTIDWWEQQIHPQDRPAVLASIKNAIQSGSAHWSAEYRFRKADGNYAHVCDCGSFVQDASGKTTRMVGGMVDITKRKRVEEEKNKFVSLVETSTDFIGMSDLQGGVLFLNEAGARTVGLKDRADALRTRVEDYFFPEDRDIQRNEFFPSVLRTGHGEARLRFRHFQTGEAIWMHYIVMLLKDDQGTPCGFGTISRNITEQKHTEERLRQSDRRGRLVFNLQFQFISILSPEGIVLDVNDLPLRAAGVRREDVVGKLFWETIWWKDLPEMRKSWPGRLAHAATRSEPVISLDRCQAADGSIRLADAAVTAVKDAQGRVEFFIVQASDITERKKSEEALKAQKALFEGLAESVLDGILIVSTEGKLLFFNQQFLNIWKLPPEILETRSDEVALAYAANQTIDPEDFRRRVTSVYAQSSPIREELRMKDGRVYDRFGGPIWKDNHHYGWVWTFREITQHKAAQAALEHKTRRTQLLADAAAQLLSADSPEQIVRDLFPRLSEELDIDVYFNLRTSDNGEGLVLDSWGGVPESELGPLKILRWGELVCGTVAQERQPWTAACVQNSADGKLHLIRHLGIRAYSCHPLIVGQRLLGTLSFGTRRRDEFSGEDVDFIGTISSFVAVAQERALYRRELEQRVTERTAKLQETVNELEHFSYTITHDMRAPLRAMKGFGEILISEAREGLSAEHRDYLQRIISSAQRMDNLIEDALNYSKLVRSEFAVHPVDTERLVRDIVLAYPAFQAPRADIHIEGHLPPVLANEAGLTQCFSNLLTNAVKFVPPGQKPVITIRSEEHDDVARLWVDDNGIGIDPQYHERIFGMFQRLSRNYEGTGIGLALVRKAVERMGGHIGVESQPKRGSHFWMEFKRCSSEEEPHVLIPHSIY